MSRGKIVAILLESIILYYLRFFFLTFIEQPNLGTLINLVALVPKSCLLSK
jgi:hypothetical protein